MAETIVINTGPLITLQRMDALFVPAQLPYSFICPEQVRDELNEGALVGWPFIDKAVASGIRYDVVLIRRVLDATEEQ
jgi:hypothetical protein